MLPMPVMAGTCAAVTNAELPHLCLKALQTVLQLPLHAQSMVDSALSDNFCRQIVCLLELTAAG